MIKIELNNKYKGFQGPRGTTGDRGATGAKGNTGDYGKAGLQGPQGDKGIKGIKGDRGDKGLPGKPGKCIPNQCQSGSQSSDDPYSIRGQKPVIKPGKRRLLNNNDIVNGLLVNIISFIIETILATSITLIVLKCFICKSYNNKLSDSYQNLNKV